jgi:putative MATE family efflux protein
MTSASTVGLLTLFSVDLVDMYFLSLLGQQELAAAIGFAGTLLFFLTAMSVGLQIAMGALVARAEGAHDRPRAGAYCTNVMVFSTLFSVMVCLPTGYYLDELLIFLGARGETLELATAYTRILLPGTPLLVVGMGAAAALRALGDAKRSMYCTLGGAFANAVLDPIFIFGFGWGIEGAALASLAARTTLFLIACFGLFRVHSLPARFGRQAFFRDMAAILPIAGPALLTNLATPIGSSYVLKTMSEFGDSAVAGAAILGRIAPVAFAAVFSLSGSVGPIVGQNAGAGLYQRVRQTLLSAMLLNVVYTLMVWLILYAMSDWIIAVFDAQGDAAVLIGFYTHYLVGGFMFVGMLFIANTTFNNLHRAYLATVFNFARMLLGTVPLVYLFSRWGPPGVMAGELGGAVLFGSMAFGVALWQVKRIEHSYLLRQPPDAPPGDAHDDSAQWAFSSQQAQLSQKCTRPEALE